MIMDMSLSKLREIVKDREIWRAAVCGVTELDITECLGFARYFRKHFINIVSMDVLFDTRKYLFDHHQLLDSPQTHVH